MTSPPSRAQQLLSCALTFRDAETRNQPLGSTFEDAAHAVRDWMSVLLHEAQDAMQTPLESAPDHPFLHPVDVDTDQPGIVDQRDEVHVMRCNPPLPRVVYRARPTSRSRVAVSPQRGAAPPVKDVAGDKAHRNAEAAMAKALSKAESRAATTERRSETQREAKRMREAETPEARESRLAEARRKREASKRAKEEREASGEEARRRPRRPAPEVCEDALLCPDVSSTVVLRPPAKKRTPGKMQFFQHPLPHHRHLQALQSCAPHASLLPALLSGEACDGLEVIQGPPGTGKTRTLVSRIASVPQGARVLLCAPTNVGAANLYKRCLAEGFEDECALALAPERVPPGTAVLSNDPSRRLVCATVSARGGPALDAHSFGAVFVDEAAQTMEAWTWTLLRPEVELLVLAGDVKQLPAMTSESGRALRHDRSLMERLVVDLKYDNTVSLTAQHRMAPEILAFPNAAFYEGLLTMGEHAPTKGSVEVVHVAEGQEEAMGTSWGNRAEAEVAARVAKEDANAVLISPYAAQCRLLLAQGTGREVHTIDSYQGHEAETIVLSVVRDGSNGLGFWSDPRRLTVALTRARTRLVVVASGVDRWPEDAPLRRLVEGLGK